MASASNHSTQAMTSQQNRDWVEGRAEEREKFIEQQEKSMQQLGSAKTISAKIRSPDFLRLVPSNEAAKLAFSELLDRKKAEELSPHHFQYMVEKGKGPLRKTINYQARSKSETPDVEDSEEPETSEISLGFFRVSFDYENVKNSATWVIGRGSARKGEDKRNVDILLAAPGSIHTKGLLAAHAYLRMHPDSGVWMIHAAPSYSNGSEESAPVAMATLDGHETLNNTFRCLDKAEALLSILGMDFCVQFALTTYPECDSYRELRNLKLKEYNLAVPDTGISGIPLVTDIRVKDLAVFSLGLGSGTFGSVYEAFDPVSGELRIVKVIEVKSESAAKLLRTETDMVKQHPKARGLVRQYGWSNSNGEITLTAKKYPFNIYIVQRKGEAFNKHLWQFKTTESALESLKLCQDLLHGLNAIHQSGWMHRDITITNILYFKGSPAEAALCDFGKLYFGKTDTDTSLAAWAYLPPEIVQGESKTYNQSIDIWMLAYALVLTWYRNNCKGVNSHKNGQITRNGLGVLRANLFAIKDHGLARLLWFMLSENPEERPSPEKALTHGCFRRLKPNLPQEAESSKGKRRHLDEDNIDVAAITEQAMRAKEKGAGGKK